MPPKEDFDWNFPISAVEGVAARKPAARVEPIPDAWKNARAVLTLLRDGWANDRNSAKLQKLWKNSDSKQRERLRTVLQNYGTGFYNSNYTGYSASAFCTDCTLPLWHYRTQLGPNGGVVCSTCIKKYTACVHCGNLHVTAETTLTHDGGVCQACLHRYYFQCDDCEDGAWYRTNNHRHANNCKCEAPNPTFVFPVADGTVPNDERTDLAMGGGQISGSGVQQMYEQLFYHLQNMGDANYRAVARLVLDGGIEPTWQTLEGNYTKRLTNALYKQYKIKLSAEMISTIGNIAQRHSSKESTYRLTFTRALNKPARNYGHPGSCYWTQSVISRCALKLNGGIGIMDWAEGGGDEPIGRAWIFPLDEELRPMQGTLGAHAYAVFNGYGTLAGYTAARIVAQLTGRTYKQVPVVGKSMYINKDQLHLVADAATCKQTKEITVLVGWQHPPKTKKVVSARPEQGLDVREARAQIDDAMAAMRQRVFHPNAPLIIEANNPF